ncbi:M28 family metallopeptidase [Alteromonas gilva]|uniref:M28 family metallopeptidase n=1 Tax=Alteromonas gilva TaxID=2987522 RepID=A0ABT5L9P2_9ALTE|nr:M28 family metallopeptidase [Alteromonas gilva]MDC8832793.1 M28 family metallopeptidase [Alteromonas gilva]
MNKRLSSCFWVFSLLCVVSGAVSAASPERFKGHMMLLADDLLAGRDTGSLGHDFASLYIASELQKMGVSPGGDNGTYYQVVPFKQSTLDMQSPRLVVSNGNESVEFEFMQNMLMSADINSESSSVTAELVFMGFGIDAPYLNYTDYEGVDLNGKIAVILSDRPHDFPSEEGSHYRRLISESLVEHGAVGVIVVSTPVSESVSPFEKRKLYVKTPSTRWLTKEGSVFNGFPQIKGSATLSIEAGKTLFDMAGIDLEAIFEKVENNEPLTSRPLGLTATIEKQSVLSETTSPNVIGIIEGSDPQLKDEYIILTAHSDHIGVSQNSVLKDKINNGAMDNASGVSTLLEIAHEFHHADSKPKRSIIFAFVTGEEKGLLGSEYYANYPTVPIEKIVANVNLDMPILTYRTNEIIAFGATHSSLESSVSETLLKNEMKLIDDPMPEQAIFVRSDQYSFVKQGVPAVFLVPSLAADVKDALGVSPQTFLAKHYHMPSDDLNLPIDYDWAAQFVEINYAIARDLANTPITPSWNEDSFFSTLGANK